MLNNAINKNMKQITNNIMMIEPVLFNFNAQTALDNHYQSDISILSEKQIQNKALIEFNNFVSALKAKFINTIVVKDSINPHTPDSIFPNNWVSFHANGSICLYPMLAKNRRLERREDIISLIKNSFSVSEIVNYSHYENTNLFLEGTGSMILDRENKICYAAQSKRTDPNILKEFCEKLKYKSVVFNAYQDVGAKRLPIYHTNVMMSIADEYVIICLESIDDSVERSLVISSIKSSNKKIIEISESQVNSFAGNMLQVMGDKPYLVMSNSAYLCLSSDQIALIESFNEIIHVDLSTIESYGGGSARCMMAEIFLPLKK